MDSKEITEKFAMAPSLTSKKSAVKLKPTFGIMYEEDVLLLMVKRAKKREHNLLNEIDTLLAVFYVNKKISEKEYEEALAKFGLTNIFK